MPSTVAASPFVVAIDVGRDGCRPDVEGARVYGRGDDLLLQMGRVQMGVCAQRPVWCFLDRVAATLASMPRGSPRGFLTREGVIATVDQVLT